MPLFTTYSSIVWFTIFLWEYVCDNCDHSWYFCCIYSRIAGLQCSLLVYTLSISFGEAEIRFNGQGNAGFLFHMMMDNGSLFTTASLKEHLIKFVRFFFVVCLGTLKAKSTISSV